MNISQTINLINEKLDMDYFINNYPILGFSIALSLCQISIIIFFQISSCCFYIIKACILFIMKIQSINVNNQ